MPGYDIHKAAHVLEWDRVVDHLCDLATCEPGRRRCAELPFLDQPGLIQLALTEVSEARELLERGVETNLGAVMELGPIVKRARVGAALDGTDLLLVGDILRASRRAKNLLEKESDRLPTLAERAALLTEEIVLEKEIFRRIERDGRVADNASDELAQLRDRYRVIHNQIHATLDSILADPKYEDVLQEQLFTLRSGRYVLPVKHEKRGYVEGIVHDISQTGQSLFIEPREVTGLNNRLRTAELEIEREIYRILLELTYKVKAIIEDLERTVEALADLDVVFAKARYSIEIDGQPVQATKSGPVSLPRARHPLLARQLEEVVPNDIVMEDARVLILSGPNTGGKTVFLKTFGLCALMLRAGLHLPCDPDGRMPVFKRIFVVIGDEQSIEKNLSSFSSHLLNLREIAQELVPGSLALIDEIGEGTDPHQGIALAKALLEHMHEQKALTVVTTHFSELMAMAQTKPGFANAAMSFDTESMTPTYHLVPGTLGRSSAFAVAERLGLPKAIVERARQFSAGSESNLDEVVKGLEEQRSRAENERLKAEAARREAEAAQAKQEQILADLRAKKAKLAEQDRETIKQELSRARALIKRIIRRLQETPSFQAAEAAREELKQVEEQTDKALPEPVSEPLPDYLEPIDDWHKLPDGAEVYVGGLRETATVLEKPDSQGRVRLRVRDKRMTLPAGDCYLLPAKLGDDKPRTPVQPLTIQAAPDAGRFPNSEIDLRGQTADEALANVDEFLDHAMRRRLTPAYLIHGHGTGVLKRTIREYLKSSPYAKSWRAGKRGEGGDGVTVVELDL